MSTYDTVRVTYKTEGEGSREGQVKCWGELMRTYTLNDHVPTLYHENSYDIAMREGGFLHIEENQIIGWDDDHDDEDRPLFDKWGNPLRPEELSLAIHGLLGNERYFFNS